MVRRSYRYYSQSDFRGGINEEPENAAPNQVLDARNMWAPNGQCIQRPGRRPAVLEPFTITDTSGGGANMSTLYWYDTSAGTYTDISGGAALSPLGQGDYIYAGWTAGEVLSGSDRLRSFPYLPGGSLTHLVLRWEYWNGTKWLNMPVFTTDQNWSTSTLAVGYDLVIPLTGSVNSVRFINLYDKDWALTTVNSLSRYWLRAKVIDFAGTAPTFDLSTYGESYLASTFLSRSRAVLPIQYNTATRYAFVQAETSASVETSMVLDSAGLDKFYDTRFANSIVPVGSSTYVTERHTRAQGFQKPTIALVADFDTAYINYDGRTTWHTAVPTSSHDFIPLVEDRDEWVGTVGGIKSPYHPDYVETLGAWPSSNFTLYFKNRVWVFGNYTYRWSEPSPAFKVWPSINYEYLSEDDRSPITGVTTFNEHIIIFKQDSIWRVVSTGVGENGLETFTAVKVVSGVGCVSNATIQQTPAGLFFLSEDGVYVFDGTNAVRISDAIDPTIQKIVAGRWDKCDSVHWRTNHCYMLAVPVNDDENDTVLLFDYKHKAWWIWTGWTVTSWVLVEGANDKEELYFTSDNEIMFQVDEHADDWDAATTAYVKTQRLGYQDMANKRFREVDVAGTNDLTSVAVTVGVNDEGDGDVTSGTIAMTDSNEAKFDTAVFDTATWSSKKRRDRRLMIRETGEWATVKVTNSTQNVPLKINSIRLGYSPLGAR